MNNKCPFCGTNVAVSPFGHVWCDQCDYRLETKKFRNRPIEDALRKDLYQARELYQLTIELCRQAEQYVNYPEPSFMEFVGIVRRWSTEHHAILEKGQFE